MTINAPIGIGRFATGEQPDVKDLNELAAQGFASVVNLREAGEVLRAFPPDDEGLVATGLGLHYLHLPVGTHDLRATDVEAFRRAAAVLPGPVYVHCGLGQRAAALVIATVAEEQATTGPQALAQAALQGLVLTPRLQRFVLRHLDHPNPFPFESAKAVA